MKQNQGAESRIQLQDGVIRKERIVKSYRIAQLDTQLRKTRNKAESTMLQRVAKLGIPTPKVIQTTEFEISMQHIPGEKVRDVLATQSTQIAPQIGSIIATLHNAHIIHGDLTTSNFLYYQQKVYIIDFGLSYISPKIEDKAVDLHVLIQAIESYHTMQAKDILAKIFATYTQTAQDAKEILAQLQIVQRRGKNKNKKTH